eukprot:g95.t1
MAEVQNGGQGCTYVVNTEKSGIRASALPIIGLPSRLANAFQTETEHTDFVSKAEAIRVPGRALATATHVAGQDSITPQEVAPVLHKLPVYLLGDRSRRYYSRFVAMCCVALLDSGASSRAVASALGSVVCCIARITTKNAVTIGQLRNAGHAVEFVKIQANTADILFSLRRERD